MTEPDTTAIRARQITMLPDRITITTAERDALCDGYDEAARLRYDLANAREAGRAYKRQRDVEGYGIDYTRALAREVIDRYDR